MMRWVLLFLIFLVSTIVDAQKFNSFELKWSAKLKSRYVVRSFLADTMAPYILNVRKGTGFFRKDYLFELKEDLSLGRKMRVQPTFNQIPLEYADASTISGKSYVFSYFNNRSHSATYLFATSLNQKSFKMAEDMRKVGQAPFVNQRVSSNFNVQTSPNDSFVLIYSQLPPSKTNRELVRFSVLDHNLQTILQEESKLPIDIETYGIEASLVDDSGNSYFVVTQEQPKNLLIRNNIEPVRILYKKGRQGSSSVVLALPDAKIVDYTLDEFNGKFRVLGFYSNTEREVYDGVFIIQYEDDLSESPEITSVPLPDSLHNQYEKKPEKSARFGNSEDDNEGLEKFSLVNIFNDTLGRAYLLSEYREFYSTAIFDGAGNEHFVDHFVHEKILVIALTKEGEIRWANQVPKYHYTTDDGGLYSSFVAMSSGDSLYFLYNDTERNYKDDGSTIPFSEFESFKRTDRSVFTMIRMDMTTGSFNMKALFSTKDAGVMIKPSVHLNVGQSRLLLYGDRGRKSRFLEIKWPH